MLLGLKGENLIGATVKLSVPGIEVGAYVGKPKSLDLPLRVPPKVPPGEVTIEVATPIGATRALFQIKELQIGGTGPTKREGGAVLKLETTAPTSCPPGMVGVGAERGGFCIEIDQTFSGDLRKAEKTCAIAGKRLCAKTEWRQACEQAQQGRIPLKNMIGDWEWTGSQVFKEVVGNTMDLRFVLLGESDCTAERQYQPWRSEVISGRCCK